MGVPARLHHYSFQDYLMVEERNPVRHEFLDGDIYAMAGGSMLHAALAGAVLGSLDAQLAGRCRVFTSDLRIRVLATGFAGYPDVTVVCGDATTDPESKETLTNPTVVIEILSPATIDYDLSEKFNQYQKDPVARSGRVPLAGSQADRGSCANRRGVAVRDHQSARRGGH